MIKIYPSDIIKLIDLCSGPRHKTQFQVLIVHKTKIFGVTVRNEKWHDVTDLPEVYEDYEYLKRFREPGQTEWQYEYPFNMEPRWEFK